MTLSSKNPGLIVVVTKVTNAMTAPLNLLEPISLSTRSFDMNFDIKKGEQVIEFTPTEEGVIPWSCWMGMIPGTFVVTEDGTATETQIQEADKQAASSGGSCGGGCGGGCGGVAARANLSEPLGAEIEVRDGVGVVEV